MSSWILRGRKLVKLQKWQNVTAFSNSFSSASSVANASPRDGRKGKSFTVSYLIDSLGLTSKLAESISKKVSFEDKGNSDSVLNVFRSYGFTDSQISGIITDNPGLLIEDAKKSLGPKLQFLQSKGASSSEITKIVSAVPRILGSKEEKTISVYYDFVKEIIEPDKSFKFKKLCHSLPQHSKQENRFRNVSALRELGVPQRLLFSLLNSGHRVNGKERFEKSLKKVVEMGFDPTSPRFVEALNIVHGLSEKTMEEKVNVYKRLGFAEGDVWEIFKKCPFFLSFSEKKITRKIETLKKCGLLEDEVLSVFKRYPQCLSVSEQNILNSVDTFLGLRFSRDEFALMVKRFSPCIGLSVETVKKKTEFLVKNMNWPLKAVALFPQCLGYSMEKRIVPRCNVLRALISKGLLGTELPPISSVLALTDEAFLKRYMVKHEKLVPELLAILTRKEEQNK